MSEKEVPRHLRNLPKKFQYLLKAHESPKDSNAFTHLGIMNGWNKDRDQWPEQYVQCQHKQGRPHKLEVTYLTKSRNRGYCSYKCNRCKIEWIVDSTD